MKVLDEPIHFKANLNFSFRRYAVWWVILLITAIFDSVTTLQFISRLSVSAEAAPVTRWLIHLLGLYAGVMSAKILQLLAVMVFAGLHRRLGNLFLLVVVVLNCWAIVINSYA